MPFKRGSVIARFGLALTITIFPTVTFAGAESGDTAWLLTLTALVLFMTIPGLALFYAGLVRAQCTVGADAVFYSGLCGERALGDVGVHAGFWGRRHRWLDRWIGQSLPAYSDGRCAIGNNFRKCLHCFSVDFCGDYRRRFCRAHELRGHADFLPIITRQFSVDDFQRGFDTMGSGQSGKVLLDWR